jgi:hypothetical protein
MSKLKRRDVAALAFVIIGGLDWGLVGFLRFDLVAWLFGGMDAPLARLGYALVGIAALYLAIIFGKLARK